MIRDLIERFQTAADKEKDFIMPIKRYVKSRNFSRINNSIEKRINLFARENSNNIKLKILMRQL